MARMRWDAELAAQALRSIEAGRTVPEAAKATGIPVETLRTWRSGRVPARVRRVLEGGRNCARCGAAAHVFADLPAAVYTYLLAVYLGDGCLSDHGRSCSLRIVLDEAYPRVVDEVCAAVAALQGRRPHIRARPRGQRCMLLSSTWKQWPCLFPQHGPGRKHHRRIELTDWQWDLVRAAPEPFLRGLIHTDGWRGLNRVRVKGKDYAYPRYQFSSRSEDIRRLFCDVCDLIGVEWRPWGRWHISVARRDSVARLDEFIGPKR